MRLTRIKVAGFKSFVDPTELKLPGSLVGIVGPNGCGKSNTIDAVRWVMGESSARHLRGESMDDVIFTGSGTRKPVNRASVELVFDNADGSLGGEYARYAEISIRREVSRDGASRYALNGTRCRRRDIRDVFLGTGLGPRSYAIIEQGMISRLIEAKPEDLRVFLEEAAGISKYKERRRETETRMRHTRDNLDRLDDLREEIDKQLEKLERQARTAERFQGLKVDERRQRGQLLGLRRRDLSAERDEQKRVIGARETELEGVRVELRAAESSIERARLQRREAADRFGVEQQTFYEVGAEVARLEQSIAHARASRSERSRELADTERSLAEARRHLEDDSRRIAQIVTAIETDQPAFERLDESRRASTETLAAAEAELAAWRDRRDAHRSAHADASRAAQVERSRIEQIERSLGAARQRAERLAAESGGLEAEPLAAALEDAVADELAAAGEEASLEASLEGVGERRLALADSLKSESRALDEARAVLGQRLGRLASLEALQQASLEPEGSAGEAWLRERALADRPRLGSRLRVAGGWERAVEVVLAGRLEAVCVDDESAIARYLEALPEASLTLVDGASGELSGGLSGGGAEDASGELEDGEPCSLADLATGHPVLEDLLAGIHAVDSSAAALALRARLAPHESVVTRDGLWFGRRWLRVAHDREEDSVLLRGAEIERLREDIAAREADRVVRDARVEELSTTLREHEARRETAQHALNDAVRRLSEVRSGLRTDRAKLQQVRERRARLDRERDEVDGLVERDAEELAEASDLRAEALGALETLEREGASLDEEEQGLRARQGALRAQVESDRGAGQALAIRVESMKSAREATERNLARVQARIGELVTRRDQLDALFADEDDDPIRALELALEDEVASRLTSEDTLGNARKALESVDERLREHERARSRHDQRAQQVREVLQATLMRSEEARVRLATLDEQVAEHGHDPLTLLDEVPEDATIPAWTEALEGIERRIAKLGPINLAAIDEHAQTLERKEYLDHQHADVSEALETLERAIASIDRETKARFRETFEAVDAKFESFFPRLFGGGHARLELTGDDLLSTGVTVVAQPPGKSVKNIQLLSGGEKALTAVALVFAFFELNPSPFCMLDEVDAPLDDANVGRFCELVREMSERVQFIFITHNKVTMELADQLMGVTMTEPGVSRLVAVDVRAAAELAGA